MKKIVYIFMLAAIVLQSCDRFLDVKPRDVKVVTTIEDYRDVMASYMIFLTSINREQEKVLGDFYIFPVFDVSTPLWFYTGGGIITTSDKNYYDVNTGLYTPKAVKWLTWLDSPDNVWNQYYKFLGPINLIINGIKTATGDNENTRNFVQGEALVWRAYSYFKLLQYYAPYKDDRYGIPVYLKPYEDPASALPERKTQTEVYAQVIADCNEALRLLAITPTNSWNMAYQEDFIHSMLAGIYSYKAMSGAAAADDWAMAEKYASAAMEGRSLATTTSILSAMFDVNPYSGCKEVIHDEVFIRICKDPRGGDNAFSIGPSYKRDVNNTVIGDIYDRFKEDDIRKNMCFKKTSQGLMCYDRYNIASLAPYEIDDAGVLIPFRLAEDYLIKAEALARQNKLGDAKVVLEEFRAARYETPTPVPSDQQGLLDMIIQERELEFYQENDMRWLDMKRLGIRMERVVNGMTHVLAPDDFRYSFPIPKTEMQNNKNMVQTPGWDNVIL